MELEINQIEVGQIRNVKEVPDAIMKCIGPIEGETIDQKGNIRNDDAWILTKDFPKPHYVIIIRLLKNSLYPEHNFCLVHLITHCKNFRYNNVKITDNLYTKSSTEIELNISSYVTRDKFLVLIDNIDITELYGHFDLEKLEKALLY